MDLKDVLNKLQKEKVAEQESDPGAQEKTGVPGASDPDIPPLTGQKTDDADFFVISPNAGSDSPQGKPEDLLIKELKKIQETPAADINAQIPPVSADSKHILKIPVSGEDLPREVLSAPGTGSGGGDEIQKPVNKTGDQAQETSPSSFQSKIRGILKKEQIPSSRDEVAVQSIKIPPGTGKDAPEQVSKPGKAAALSPLKRLLSKNKGQEIPVTLSESEKREMESHEITKKLEVERKSREGLGRFFKHPVQVLTEKPINIMIVTIPLSLIIFAGGFISMVQTYGITVLFDSTIIDDFAIFALLVTIIPLAVLDFREERRVINLEQALPNFFRDLAGMNDSGMTLPNAVHLVAGAEYGTLTPHIKKLDNEMSWGVGFVEALAHFGTGLGTKLADRSVDLIAKASKAGGDVSEVLRAAAMDTFEVVNLAQERRNNMLIYMVIVLVSFAVFLFVIAILVSTFLTTMATAGAAASASGAGQQFMGNVDVPAYKRLFSHAGMIQGFFSGLVAGQMSEGRAIGGLKYSAMMVIIAWVTFRFLI